MSGLLSPHPMALTKFITFTLLGLCHWTSIVDCNKLCLIRPFVSSIADVTFTVPYPGKSNYLRFTLTLELNYKRVVKIENFDIERRGAQSTFYDTNSATITETGELIPGVRFTRDRIIERGLNSITIIPTSYYKTNYDKELKRIIERHKGLPKSARECASICSNIYIYDADYFAAVNSTHNLRVLYHKSIRCANHYTKKDNNSWRAEADITPIIFPIQLPNNIASAFFIKPFLFQITTDSRLYMREFVNEVETSNVPGHNPLGRDLPVLEEYLSNFPTNENGLLRERTCFDRIRDADLLKDSAKVDFMTREPYNTLSRLSPELFVAVEANLIARATPYVTWRDPKTGAHEMKVSQPPPLVIENHPLGQLKLEALSILIDGTTKYTEAIFLDYSKNIVTYHKHKRTLGTKESTKIVEYPYVLPDDITHWAACKKIVSVYGFAYTLHGYEQDILNEPSQWNMFDENLFDHPIEAMHAEGNEFWFLTKRSTVRIMVANPGNCSVLSLKFVGEVQLSQLFDAQARQVNVEDRYFDGYNWVPPLDFVPSYPIRRSKSSVVWPYILVGLFLTIACLIVVLVYILKSSSRDKGGIIYSKSKGSLHSAISELEPKEDLPLFSQLKTTGSIKSANKQSNVKSKKSKTLRSPKISKSLKTSKSLKIPTITKRSN